jgi:integrase/recombinase XerD
MTTIPSTAIVVYDPDLAGPRHVALAGFFGGYRGLTRDAYALDLRQFVAFCERRRLGLFTVRRSDIETFGRELEARGRATVGGAADNGACPPRTPPSWPRASDSRRTAPIR